MAIRPVYVVKEEAPYFRIVNVEFEWNKGFAKSQKQKNIKAIHESFSKAMPDKKVLEISSKSTQEGGEALGAFFLKKYVPELDRSIPVECVFQSGKVFQNGGPFKDLMSLTPREAKRDERLKSSGKLIYFIFNNIKFPLIPKTIFYDYIYINALLENKELAKKALKYDAFTDIEFNPDKSINCQAKSAAIFVAMSRLYILDDVTDFDKFQKLFDKSSVDKKIKKSQNIDKKINKIEHNIRESSLVKHKLWGIGNIEKIDNTSLKVVFDSVGIKTLGLEWCLNNCEIINLNK